MPNRPLTKPWALLTVLTVLMWACYAATIGHWRWASAIIALSLGLAGAMRAVLPAQTAGLLVVRSRLFDVVVYLGFACAITAAALVVPGR